jgi:transposase
MVKAVYPIYLTSEERETLSKVIKAEKASAHMRNVARVLLQLDRSEGKQPLKDGQLAAMFSISRKTVMRIKKRFYQEGLRGVLSTRHSKDRPRRIKIQEHVEAELIGLARGAPPAGTKRWTLRALAEKMVELKHVDSISHETVRQILKKMSLKPS